MDITQAYKNLSDAEKVSFIRNAVMQDDRSHPSWNWENATGHHERSITDYRTETVQIMITIDTDIDSEEAKVIGKYEDLTGEQWLDRELAIRTNDKEL